jgi:hypothetical protein
MIAFIRNYWERIVLLLVTTLFFLLVGSGVYLQKRNNEELKISIKTPPANVQIQLTQKNVSQSRDIASPSPTSFYLKPLPGELLEQIANLDSLDEKVATGKFSGLPVMWEVYFFSFEKLENNAGTVHLDVSEDGFGVIVVCDADVDEFPEITEIERGKKIWVAGEILSVDPSGTGTIYLKTDYLRFTEREEGEPSATTVVQ